MNDRRNGFELWHALSRFSPDVFSHPVWMNYIKSEKPPSDSLIQELVQESQSLISEGDVNGACQVLFLCAGLHKRLGNNETSLDCLQRAWELADSHKMPEIAMWAAWGSCALYILLRQPDQAVNTLNWLNHQLITEGDWVLANLVELFAIELTDRAKGSKSIEIPLEWLLHWGDVPGPMGIYGSMDALSRRVNGHSFPYRITSIFSGAWVHLKKITKGQFGSRKVDRENPSEQKSKLFDRYPVSIQSGFESGEKSNLPSKNSQRPNGALSSNHLGSPLANSSSNQMKLVDHSLPVKTVNDRAMLTVYCFGSFRVLFEDQWITNWSSGKGKAIFKYLIANSPQPIPKEVLMDTFWRDADPEAARNNLYVAIYGLRQAFKSVQSDYNPVLFEKDHYRLNPTITMWVDVDEFKQRYRVGQRLEQNGRLVDAINEYEKAKSLYLGDFLEDDLYDDWTVPRREGYKDTYLIILDRLSRYYLDEGEYITCIQICQDTLAKDDCREDAHRRLMRCYSLQGQRHLALRQYHLCTEALARELGVSPTHETSVLYDRIRNEGVVE